MPTRKLFHGLIALPILLLWLSSASAWSGKVVSVIDGDKIIVLRNEQHVKIRLYGIDCPEKKQPYGKRAKQFTNDMVAGRNVEVKEVKQDSFAQIVGIVEAGGKCLNEELLRAGCAWALKVSCSLLSCSTWPALEVHARTAGIGLWSDSDPVPPWEWRRKGE